MYTKQDGIDLIYKITSRLNKDGYNISTANLGTIDFNDADGGCGYTLFEDSDKYKIVINNKLLKKNKLNFLKCTIYHELAHIIQYNETIQAKIIQYNKQENCIDIICGDAEIADALIFNNYHHTQLWFDIAKDLTMKYNIIPQITAYLNQTDLEKFLEEIFMTKLQRPNEPHIDYTISGLTIDDMMKYNIKLEYLETDTAEILQEDIKQSEHNYRNLDKYLKREDN